MCVIVDKPCGKIISDYKLKNAIGVNKDGMGVMYVDPLTGEFVQKKWLPKNLLESEDLITKEFERLKNVHAVFHLRYRTHGLTSMENCHPFQVLNKAEHGRDLYMMHNGMISITSGDKEDKDKSDTALFVEYVVRPTLKYNPEMLHEYAYQCMLAAYVDSSRLLFMDDLGRIVRVGKWEKQEGCVVSNNNYWTRYQSSGQQGWAGYSTVTGSRYNEDVYHGHEYDSLVNGKWVTKRWNKETKQYDTFDASGGARKWDPATGKYIPAEPTIESKLPATQQGNGCCATPRTPAVIEEEKQKVIEDANKRAEHLKNKAEGKGEEVSGKKSQGSDTPPFSTESSTDRPGDEDLVYDESEDEDVVMVWTTKKKADEVTVEDLSALAVQNDLYDFVCDYPEKSAELMEQLVQFYEMGEDAFNTDAVNDYLRKIGVGGG